MQSLILIAITSLAFFLGYRFYARFLTRLWDIDPEKTTPAFEKHDGVDFVPAKHPLVLFGHHFASISGAGPIIGPAPAIEAK